jgi:hypothetical protein
MTKPTVTQRLHERMHQLPWVPEHDSSAMLNHRGGKRNPARHNPAFRDQGAPTNEHHRQPQVLIGWQDAIGRLFARSR